MELLLKEAKANLQREEERLEREFPGRAKKNKQENGRATPINRARARPREKRTYPGE